MVDDYAIYARISKYFNLLNKSISNNRNLNYQILDYHWSNKKKIQKDIRYIKKLYNKILDILVEYFNHIHNTNFSKKFWEIIIYRWLWLSISLLYDRWEIISTLQKKRRKIKIKIFKNR